MNRTLLVAALLAFFTPGLRAQDYNPKFDKAPSLEEFRKAATDNTSVQAAIPFPPVVFEEVKTISLKGECKPELKKEFLKAGPGYFYGPYPPRIYNSGPYQSGLLYIPRLKEYEHPTAYALLSQWDGVNTTRGQLLDEANVLDPKDQALYAEAVQIDQNAAALNQERDKLNAEIAKYNQTCVGVPYPPYYCPSWSSDLDRRIADLKHRIDVHNAKVSDWRNRKKTFDGLVGAFINRIISWEKNINDFISKAEAFLTDYGKCTKEEHYQLQQAVKNACKLPPLEACDASQDCLTLKSNYNHFMACYAARVEINNKCYDGGDLGHSIAADNALRGANNCRIIIQAQCNDNQVPSIRRGYDGNSSSSFEVEIGN